MNLAEAFRKLNLIESDEFDIDSPEGKQALDDFMSYTGAEEEPQVVIDPEAESEEELEDSYIGKAIIQCPICRSLIYKNMEDLGEDEEESCPYCYSEVVMDVIGKVAPIEETPEEALEPEMTEEEPAPAAEEVPEMEDRTEAPLEEDLENVTIETEDEVINISAEPKCEGCEEEEEVPEEEEVSEEEEEVSEEEEEEVPEEEEPVEVIAPLDEPEDDLDEPEDDFVELDDVDEDSFDEFAESWLKSDYKNIRSYKTTKMTESAKNRIKVEGVVTLKNGSKKLLEFRVKPGKLQRNKRGVAIVENLNLKKRTAVKFKVK